MSELSNTYARLCTKYQNGADISREIDELGHLIKLLEHKSEMKNKKSNSTAISKSPKCGYDCTRCPDRAGCPIERDINGGYTK